MLTADARRWLATRGYDPVFGARPLKRVIQKNLLDPLAMKLLTGDLHDGERVVAEIGPDGDLQLRGPLTAAAVVA